MVSNGVRTKLEVGARSNPMEREADLVSEQVMRMAETAIDDPRSLSDLVPVSTVQTKPASEGRIPGQLHPLLAPELAAVRASGGSPLTDSTRTMMQARIGHDFAGVRVHTDARSSSVAEALHARALTVGQDVIFGNGNYRPSTYDGQKLLAHELVHVVQQGSGTPLSIQRQEDDERPGAGEAEPMPAQALSATSERGAVIITLDDGTQQLRKGGTRSWRNNNPGNMRHGATAIGSAGGFAVFADYDAGFSAMLDQLGSETFQKLTIKQTIARWAPPSENDTTAYLAAVRRQMGMDLATKLSDLNGEQLEMLANTIQRIEGWGEGTVTTRPVPKPAKKK
ncbi:MAG TPA: DUF4157 domain-containing protein [Polyangiaceae bacterium]